MNLTGYQRRYAELATNAVIPKRYVCGRNYYLVKQHLVNNSRLLLTSPKRVGKSTCLLVCWEMCQLNKKAILLGVDTMQKFGDYTVREYLKTLSLTFLQMKNLKISDPL